MEVFKSSDKESQISHTSAASNSFALAVAVIRERIDTLPKDDKDDLYSLLPSVFSEDDEERDAANKAVSEILEQKPATIRRLEIDEPNDCLDRWLSYVSDKIKSLRKNAGMTQEALAKATGLPQSHISRLENGEHSPTAKTLERIAKALGVEAQELDPSA